MQNNVFMAMALCGCGFSIKAQPANAKVRYVSSKTQRLGAACIVEDAREEKVTVEVTQTAIKIVHANKPTEILTGSFTNVSCLWKEAFSKGKTIINTTLNTPHGNTEKAIITIEAADGAITILVEGAGQPGKTLLLIDRHEEVIN